MQSAIHMMCFQHMVVQFPRQIWTGSVQSNNISSTTGSVQEALGRQKPKMNSIIVSSNA